MARQLASQRRSSVANARRIVVDTDTAIRIASGEIVPSPSYTMFAPTVLRSQVLATLYESVRRGELPEEKGLAINANFAKLKFRYLGDAVMRRQAWAVAQQKALSSTALAEYISLTQLQADALATVDKDLCAAADGLVRTVDPRSLVSDRLDKE